MAVKNEVKFSCDLCNNKETTDGEEPDGWIVLTLENPFVDRDFYDRHICKSCATTIRAILKKAA